MSERTIRLDLSYDGTDFSGWQRQKNARSVQEELEKALAALHEHPMEAVGAGRTDAGVHAERQTAHFRTDMPTLPGDRFRLALNRFLPRDVRILESREADTDFHARYDARLRTYRYFIETSRECPPWRARYAWHLRRVPDLRSLNAMASILIGETDFTAFSAARDPSVNRYRFVHSASWRFEGGQAVFEISANAFLLRMVRSLVGSMVEYQGEGRDASWMREVLESRDRSRAGSTAPACGLFLWNVEYYERPTRAGRTGVDLPD
jgi:tRNA pseudouridine38-40 synthase